MMQILFRINKDHLFHKYKTRKYEAGFVNKHHRKICCNDAQLRFLENYHILQKLAYKPGEVKKSVRIVLISIIERYAGNRLLICIRKSTQKHTRETVLQQLTSANPC